MQLIFGILAYGVEWALEAAFLFLALWLMVRIQKLQYTLVGLAISAGIACVFDLIPFVGHYIAAPVLWVCLTKVTREDFTGVVFTAAISYALVFGMNLFLLSALMGDLRPSARARSATNKEIPVAMASEEDIEEASAAPAARDQSPVSPAPKPPTEAAPEKQPSNPDLERFFELKSITHNGNQSMVMVSAGAKNYVITLGESISIDTSEGKKDLRLEKVEKDSVTFGLAGQSFKWSVEKRVSR